MKWVQIFYNASKLILIPAFAYEQCSLDCMINAKILHPTVAAGILNIPKIQNEECR